jgi:hypothetical protein
MAQSHKSILLTFLFLLGLLQVVGQTSTVGIRLAKLSVNNYTKTQLEGAPVIFSNWYAQGHEDHDFNIAFAGFYEFYKKSTIYKRVIFQYEANLANDGTTWNLADGERATLSLHRSSPAITGAFSMGRFWQIKRLRFAFGFEAGITYSPSFEQLELYTFFDSLSTKKGLISFRTTEIADYQPYLKWFGSGYYRFSKNFSIGLELTYGLVGYYRKGTKSIVRKDMDPLGTVLGTSTQNTNLKDFYVNLPQNITLPYLGISYLLGDRKNNRQAADQ